MKWWKYIFNLQTITLILVIAAVIYCLVYIKKKKHKFHGLGESGWNVAESKNHWDYGLTARRKSGKRKLPRYNSRAGQKPPRKPRFNKHEEKCRTIFQQIYRKPFVSCRPGWLKNPVTGRNLELDGFCADIPTPAGQGLAFEYDGVQHSKFNKHFHRSGAKEFEYQTKKDEWKDLRCEQEGITLVRIPHFVAYRDLERYITRKLDKLQLLPVGYGRGRMF